MILYRPVDIHELQLIYEAGMRAFPPRLPGQPIFYPVLNAEYAGEIAQRWNAPGPSQSGYVTRFEVDESYVQQFEVRQVGAKRHLELWVPSDELSSFNRQIRGLIQVVRGCFGVHFPGHIPTRFGMRGMNAVEQFVALAGTFAAGDADALLEIRTNHASVFLNYLFWSGHDFGAAGLDQEKQQRTLARIAAVWARLFPSLGLPGATRTPRRTVADDDTAAQMYPGGPKP